MPKYNILHIHSHDIGRQIDPYGFLTRTPNLMKFAKEGTLMGERHITPYNETDLVGYTEVLQDNSTPTEKMAEVAEKSDNNLAGQTLAFVMWILGYSSDGIFRT